MADRIADAEGTTPLPSRTANEVTLAKVQVVERVVLKLIQKTGQAVQVLAGAEKEVTMSGQSVTNATAIAQERFADVYQDMINLLNAVQTNLRQIFSELEEAGILSAVSRDLIYQNDIPGQVKDLELSLKSVWLVKAQMERQLMVLT